MRYRELNEVRRNPDQNPKTDPISVLEKYNNYGYYMSYTAIDKLGLNPKSGYSTPIGIYSYPIIDGVISGIISAKNMTRVPYMGEAPYVWIFKPKNPDRGLIIGDYTGDDYDNDTAKLYNHINKKNTRIAGVFDEFREIAENESKHQTPAGYIWNVTRVLAKLLTGNESLSYYVGNILKIGDLVHVGTETAIAKIVDVYPDEKEYSVLYPDGETIYVKFDEVSPTSNTKKDVPLVDSKYSKLLNKLKSEINVGVNATNPNAKTQLWNIIKVDEDYGTIVLQKFTGPQTINVSIERFLKANPKYKTYITESIVLEYQKNTTRANRDAVMWTYLLHNVLGYDYVDDSDGTGLIHANEPVQAVFFNINVINVSKKLDNPNRDTDDISVNSVFGNSKNPEDIERIDQKIIEKLFKYLLKQKIPSMSSGMPYKFMGHLVVNSSKLQAQLLLSDSNFSDYFKKINPDTIPIMDQHIIKKINEIPSGNMEYGFHLRPLFNYFNKFHKGEWANGERAILNKAYNDNNAALIIEYCYRVRRKPWPEAEFIILKNPIGIPTYAEKILHKRWPAGEKALTKIDQQRGSWLLDSYASEFNITVDDIGKI